MFAQCSLDSLLLVSLWCSVLLHFLLSYHLSSYSNKWLCCKSISSSSYIIISNFIQVIVLTSHCWLYSSFFITSLSCLHCALIVSSSCLYCVSIIIVSIYTSLYVCSINWHCLHRLQWKLLTQSEYHKNFIWSQKSASSLTIFLPSMMKPWFATF